VRRVPFSGGPTEISSSALATSSAAQRWGARTIEYVAGPPVLLVWAGMVLLALMLAGPFALMAMVVVALAAATVLVAFAGVVVASPFLLVRHLRTRRQRRAVSAPARPLASVQPQHVAA
jgi:hypothetical protein